MKKIMLMAIVMMALLAVSCQKEKDEELPTFTAHADNGGMKTDLVGNLICWNNTDQVKMFGDFGYAVYGVTPRNDDPTWATLTPIESHGLVGLAPYRFVYPASMAEGSESNNNTLFVNYPAERNISDSPLQYFPMFGVSDNHDVAFRNLGGLVKLVLPEIDREIVQIRISTDEANNGKYQIGNDGGLVYAGENTDADKSVLVNVGGLTFAEGDYMYISMPACQYHNFTIEIYSADEVARKVGSVVNVQSSVITTINISNLVFENREWPVATLRERAFYQLYATGLIFHYNYTDDVTGAERIDCDQTNSDATPIHKRIINNVCHVYTPASEIYAPTNSNYLFAHTRLQYISFGTGFNTSNVTSMVEMFYGCDRLTSLDVSHFNTSNVTDMHYMFYGCSGLTSLNISSFNTANVTDMRFMFEGCRILTSLNLSSFSSNSLTDFNSAFLNCTALSSIQFSNSFTLRGSCDVTYALRNVGNTRTTTIKCNSQTKNRLMNADPGSRVVWDLY